MIILQLNKKVRLGKHIIKTRLPSRNIAAGDIVLMKGFSGPCTNKTSHDIQQTKLIVNDSEECFNGRSDRFCIQESTSHDLVRAFIFLFLIFIPQNKINIEVFLIN